MPKKISKEREEEIIGLKKAGFTQKRIAKMTGLSDFTVKRVWRESRKRALEEPEPEPDPVSEMREARVVRLVPNQRMVLAEVDGVEGHVRLIKRFGKPDVLGRKVMRCERIEDDLWRVVKL